MRVVWMCGETRGRRVAVARDDSAGERARRASFQAATAHGARPVRAPTHARARASGERADEPRAARTESHARPPPRRDLSLARLRTRSQLCRSHRTLFILLMKSLFTLNDSSSDERLISFATT
jgi:hypothetical protein